MHLVIGCKIPSYLSFALNEFTIWISVVNSIDRYVSIKYPDRFNFRKSYTFQTIILSIVFVLSLILYFPYYYFYDTVLTSNSTDTFTFTCMVTDPVASFYLDMFNLSFCALIPFLVMILSSAYIGYHLRFRRTDLKKDLKLFKILISMDIFFFICYTPFCIIVLIGDTVTVNNMDTSIVLYVIFMISYFLLYFYGSCSFIVHYISNLKFRNEFKLMIGIKTKERHIEQTFEVDDDL